MFAKHVDQWVLGEKRRFYHIPEYDPIELLPGVTTVLDFDDKAYLNRWKVNKERELAIEAAANLYIDVPMPGVQKMSRVGYINTLQNRIGKERGHEKESRIAADIGTGAHDLIEHTIHRDIGIKDLKDCAHCKSLRKGVEPLYKRESLNSFASWQAWRDAVNLEPIRCEQAVYSRELGVAGTLDLLGRHTCELVSDRVLSVLDWKSGKDIYISALVQVSVYGYCAAERGLVPNFDELHYAVVHLPKNTDQPDFDVEEFGPAEAREYVEQFRHMRADFEFYWKGPGSKSSKDRKWEREKQWKATPKEEIKDRVRESIRAVVKDRR